MLEIRWYLEGIVRLRSEQRSDRCERMYWTLVSPDTNVSPIRSSN
jgi:hypothetical protein